MAVGIDIVHLTRIKDIDSFANKILSQNELSLMNERIDKISFIGGRFAAKEAFLKMNHCRIGGIPFKEIEVLNKKEGTPFILYKNKEYDLSIAHDGEYAIAICME